VDGLKQIMSRDFAVIICDMMMPNLPGDMFYRAVERTKPHLCQRFIFITGFKGNRDIEDFIRKVNGVMLWKPFETQQLMDAIQVVLQKTGG
jgi:DNA-binding NarL/FixJ family response regulator